MANEKNYPRTLIILATVAAAGIVLALMNVSAELINILLLSWILVLIATPLLRRLKHRMPTWLAFILTLGAVFGVIFIVGMVLVVGINKFVEAVPSYLDKYDSMMEVVQDLLKSLGINSKDIQPVADFTSLEPILEFIGGFLSGLVGKIGNVVMMVLFVVFLLIEESNAPRKLTEQIKSGHTGLKRLFKASGLLRDYVVLATLVGLATGVLDTIWFIIMGVDFPLLWGTLAFLLSYIPSIGFWLAAIPPTILALLESGPLVALVVFLGIVLINGFAENVIKPKYMGEGVNFSPFMIVFSVIFWTLVLGPMGAILGVPMMILFKETILEGDEETRWIAHLMSSSKAIKEEANESEPAGSE